MIRLVRVAGESMAPTYRPSDLLLTAPVGRAGPRARRGDVVVLAHGGVRMVKRVAAVAGDVVELAAGRLSVDGRPADGQARVPGPVTQTWRVSAGRVFVTGDNARVSDDSRVWTDPFVAVADVEARVVRRLPVPGGARWLRPRRPAAAARPAG